MALAKVGQKITGHFTESNYNKRFEFCDGAPCEWSGKQGATHTVYVNALIGDGNNTRPAKVLKTVVYMGLDENETGGIVWKKWKIKGHKVY